LSPSQYKTYLVCDEGVHDKVTAIILLNIGLEVS